MDLNGDSDIKRENLAMKIVIIKEKQLNGKISFDDFLLEAIELIKKYESQNNIERYLK